MNDSIYYFLLAAKGAVFGALVSTIIYIILLIIGSFSSGTHRWVSTKTGRTVGPASISDIFNAAHSSGNTWDDRSDLIAGILTSVLGLVIAISTYKNIMDIIIVAIAGALGVIIRIGRYRSYKWREFLYWIDLLGLAWLVFYFKDVKIYQYLLITALGIFYLTDLAFLFYFAAINFFEMKPSTKRVARGINRADAILCLIGQSPVNNDILDTVKGELLDSINFIRGGLDGYYADYFGLLKNRIRSGIFDIGLKTNKKIISLLKPTLLDLNSCVVSNPYVNELIRLIYSIYQRCCFLGLIKKDTKFESSFYIFR